MGQSFVGEFPVKIDGKGRMQLPAKHRAGFDDGLVWLVAAPDRCLRGYRTADYDARVAELASRDLSVQANRQRLRTFGAYSSDVKIDAQGRITVPETLRQYAGFADQPELTVIGSGPYLEFWNSDAWQEIFALGADDLANLDIEGAGL